MSPASVPVADALRRIVEDRRRRFPGGSVPAATGADRPLSRAANGFLAALDARRGRAVIAEIKMGSPTLGSLAGRFRPEDQARRYADHGAAALSVVVEEDSFGGSYELLASCRRASGLPAIAKDFVIHERQLDLARGAGAEAVLLVAALYDESSLPRWAAAARDRGLAPLVEVHDAAELDLLGGGEWELVGVNNRDLRTFQVDLDHGVGLAPLLPGSALRVAESGIRRGEDIERLRGAGFDAFLVGEALLTAEDPLVALEELL